MNPVGIFTLLSIASEVMGVASYSDQFLFVETVSATA